MGFYTNNVCLNPFPAMKINLMLFVFIAFAACTSNEKRTYAVRDFREELQPYLVKTVTNNIVGNESSWSVQKNATDDELMKLSQSEIPMLRAVAFREIMRRPGFNHFDIIMSHLNDTAMVEIDAGEWGTAHTTVSDDMIEAAVWKDSSERQMTIDSVIISHNYLRSAYSYKILPYIEPKEKYYASIKQMAELKKGWFPDTEYALLALAKYKKSDDIIFIKEELMSNLWKIGSTSFWLMREYPNDTYLEVLSKYYRTRFYRLILENATSSNAGYFIKTLGIYKNDQTSALIDSILNRKPFIPYEYSRDYSADTNSLKRDLAYAIWDNPCNAYSRLRKQVESHIRKYEKNKIEMEIEPFIDTFPVSIRW